MTLLTTTEAGKLLRMCPSSVRTLCDQRKLKVVRHTPNGRRLIVEESIHAYLETVTEAPRESFEAPRVVFDDDADFQARIQRLKRAK